jgi:hypothetical protein
MKGRIGFVALVVAVLSATLPFTASASVFTQGLSYDGVVDIVQDNSVALALFDSGPDVNGDGVPRWRAGSRRHRRRCD